MLAVPTITIGGRTDFAFSGNTFFFFAPLLIPVVILGVPILDTVFSFVRRTRRDASTGIRPTPATSTTGSMRLGHGPRRTVAILWAWTALLSGVALVARPTPNEGNALVPFVAAALALLPVRVVPPRRPVGAGSRRSGPRHPTGGGRADDVVDLDRAPPPDGRRPRVRRRTR